MKNIYKIIAVALLFSIITISPLSVLAEGFSYEESLNYNDDGTLKEGFVEVNPWENNFESVDVDSLKMSRSMLTDTVIYSEEEAKEVYEELQKASEKSPYFIDSEVSVEDSMNLMKPIEYGPLMSTQALKSKSWYRTEFKALALYAGTISLPTAGNYLNYSLQDKPSHRVNDVGSGHANALSLTKMYTTISIPMAETIKSENAKGKTTAGGTGSIATSVGNVGLDFYLTYGKVSYSWGAVKKSNGTWTVSIAIVDKYNYEKIKKIDRPFPYSFIDLANNHAADAQTAGAIVEYNITNMFNQTYKP